VCSRAGAAHASSTCPSGRYSQAAAWFGKSEVGSSSGDALLAGARFGAGTAVPPPFVARHHEDLARDRSSIIRACISDI
jgi:hypothetical protein